MPPKTAKKVTVPVVTNESSLTKENFEKELIALKAKAQTQTPFRQAMGQVAVVAATLRVLAYAAAYSRISQYALSPVYGAIPAAIFHERLVMTSAFLGWSSNLYLKRILPPGYQSAKWFLPAVAFYIPVIQLVLFRFSGWFGALWGPLVTEALTFAPLLILSAAHAAELLDDIDVGGRIPPFLADAAPGMISWGVFKGFEIFFSKYIQEIIGFNIFVSRTGMQFVLNGCYAMMAPSNIIFFAVPGLFHTIFMNPHFQSPWATFDLRTQLSKHDYKLLDRQDSLTGYISVLESTKDNFRVMRCDHSLLGGEWLPAEDAPFSMIHEPIYGVFAMLESVRLVEVKTTPSKSEKKSALVIGLGIGTTPSALIAHGINTTIVEIDPVVYEYARRYFNLPKKHNAVIADAVAYTSEQAQLGTKFDYIVHDVFTGGAEPISLFTVEFMQDLRSLLKPSGAIAINYAGDILLPSARLVIRTIKSVFPSCRIYRESAPPTAEELADEARDFTNMVIFCNNEDAKITFRKPLTADYLGSRSRELFLVPKFEIESTDFEIQDEDETLISRDDTNVRFAKWQEQSAVGHWNVMRTVLPDYIWEWY